MSPIPSPSQSPIPSAAGRSNGSPRVVLADDHAAIREGLRIMLENAGIPVVGEAADGAGAVHIARLTRPDVVLMDLRMPGMDGVEATRRIVQEGLADVLVLTSFDVDELVLGALRAGAAGFLLKTADAGALIDAVRRVGSGDGVLSPEVVRTALAALASAPDAASDSTSASAVGRLTEREREVLAGLADGLSNAAIATRLTVSTSTVKTHVSSVLAKLELSSRMQAAALARRAGLGS